MNATVLRAPIGLAVALLLLAASVIAAPAPARAAINPPTHVRTIGGPGHAGVYAWGAATARDGSILIGDYNNYVVRRYAPSGALQQTFSGLGRGPGQNGQPYGLAVSPVDGRIFLADNVQREVEIFAADGSYHSTIDVNKDNGVYASRVAVGSQGRLYVVSSQNISTTFPHRILMYGPDGAYLGFFGSTGTGPGQSTAYRGIAISAQDEVFIADAGGRRIQVFGPDGTYLRAFGSSGNGPGQFGYDMRGLAIDKANGWVYAVDAALQRVTKFTTAGQYLTHWQVYGPDGGESGPREATIGLDGTVYVTDYTNERVVAYTPQGQPVGELPDPPQPARAGGFNQPEGVAVDRATGAVYVTDTFNNRVQKFSATGQFLQMWGFRGREHPDAMDYPRGVAVDPRNGNVWVNNTRSANIKAYTSGGAFIRQFGSQGANPDQLNYARGIHVGAQGRIFIPDSFNRRLKAVDQQGRVAWTVPCGAAQRPWPASWILQGCTSVTQDAAGNIYAAAPTEGVVYKLDATGQLIARLGTPGSGPEQLTSPYGVAISGNRLYVSDIDANRVHVLDLSGAYQGSFGSQGTRAGQFRRPSALALDAAGRLYVADTGNDRVQVFQP